MMNTPKMLHLGHFVVLLIAVSTLSPLTSGQSTVDTEMTNERCDNSGDYTSLLTELLAGLKSQSQQQECSCGESYNAFKPPAVDGILVQQHIGDTVFFNRSWEEFKVGFGNSSDNYWIGNERLHQLTKDGRYKLRVDLLSKFTGLWYWAEYDRFIVSSEHTDYTLYVGDYSGNAGDGMTVDGVTSYTLYRGKFETYDHPESSRCVSPVNEEYIGGFWYPASSCGGHALLNRKYQYFSWKNLPVGTGHTYHVALLQSRMMLLEKKASN